MDATTTTSGIPAHIVAFERDAAFVQSACNLLAVLNSFARHVKECRDNGGNWSIIDRSDASRLFAHQILYLTGGELPFSRYSEALKKCEAHT